MYTVYSVFDFDLQHSGYLFPTIFHLIWIVYILYSEMI